MRAKICFIVSGFFGGIIIHSFLDFGPSVIAFSLLFCLAFLTLKEVTLTLICLGVALGLWRYEVAPLDNSPKPSVELSGLNGGVTRLAPIKQAFDNKIEKVILEPEASLGEGLIIEGKNSLDQDLLNRFRTAGLIHVVALSGYNVTVVAENVMYLFATFLPLALAQLLGVLAVILFALLAGASSTVVRASIMALIAVLGRASGRVYDVTVALVVAACVMVLWNPKILVFDMGFQLSFLATLGLIYLEPIFSRKLTRVPEKLFKLPLRSTLATTLAAQTAVLPWILYKFGNLSLVALPVNLLVLPFVPYAMFLVFLAGALGFVLSLLSLPFAWLSYFVLAYIIGVVNGAAVIPYASVQISNFPFVLVLLSYAVMIYLVFCSGRASQRMLKSEA